MYIFNANKEQLLNLGKNLFNASKPVGNSHKIYDPNEQFDPNWIEFYDNNRIYLDYLGGRIVKVSLSKIRWFPGYEFAINARSEAADKPKLPRQSWATTYPCYEDLFKASDINDYLCVENR